MTSREIAAKEIALGMKMTNLCLVLVGVEQHQLKEVVDVH